MSSSKKEKEFQIDIYTGEKHKKGTKRYNNYRKKLEKDLKNHTLEELKKSIQEKKKKKEIIKDCKNPCKEDEICNTKTGRCVLKDSTTGKGVLRKLKEIKNLPTEFLEDNWDIIKMPGDNHCGYHAFLYGLRSIMDKHPKLDFNQDIKDLILNLKYILLRHYKDNDNDNYKKILNDSNCWLDDTDLQVLANYFNVCIYMYDSRLENIEGDDIKSFTKIAPLHEKKNQKYIYMYQSPNHFDVMFPKGENIKLFDIKVSDSQLITDKDLREYMVEKGILDKEEFEEEEDEEPIYEEIEELDDIEEELEVIKPIYKFVKEKPVMERKKVLSDGDIQDILRSRISKKDFPNWLK